MRSLALALLVFGCSNNTINNNGGDGGSGQPDMATAANVMSLQIGPIPLASGQERTICSTFRLSNTAQIDVVQIDTQLAPGSHHLILYKSMATAERKDIYDCPPLDISNGDIPLYIAETQNDNKLPLPTGVSYQLAAGQMVRLEAHYINATPNAIMGQGNVHLTVGDSSKSYQAADIMFCGSVTPLAQQLGGQGVPPGMSMLPPAFFAVPAGIKIFGLTTHEHKRGSLMTIDKSSSTAAGQNLTMGQPYDNPPFVVYDDNSLLTFNQGEGLRWQCFYNNPDNMTYYFGQSAQSNEMCFLWAYYFPSVGHFISQECWR